jgi:methylamine--corrinoid protein Co-methyltransferase
MIPLIDFQDRSLKGPVMKADKFDLAFAMKVREVVEKYNIKYTPEEMLAEESIGDAVFQAGVDVLEAVGLYHLGTQRVIKFTREEILE